MNLAEYITSLCAVAPNAWWLREHTANRYWNLGVRGDYTAPTTSGVTASTTFIKNTRPNQAWTFSTGYVQLTGVNPQPTGTDTFTIIVPHYPTTVSTGGVVQHFQTITGEEILYKGFYARYTGGTMLFRCYAGGSTHTGSLSWSAGITANSTQFLFIRYNNATNPRFSVRYARMTQTAGIDYVAPDDSSVIELGRVIAAGTTFSFAGKMDEVVMLWGSYLTDAQCDAFEDAANSTAPRRYVA